jgi:A/G-specific adenine glycosylase
MDKKLWALSRAVLPHKHVFDFNQALMDLGATICVARTPRCAVCPMKAKCKTAPRVLGATIPHAARRPRRRN